MEFPPEVWAHSRLAGRGGSGNEEGWGSGARVTRRRGGGGHASVVHSAHVVTDGVVVQREHLLLIAVQLHHSPTLVLVPF